MLASKHSILNSIKYFWRNLSRPLTDVLPFFLISRAIFLLIVFFTSSVDAYRIPSREGGLFHLMLREEGLFSPGTIKKFIQTLLSADAAWYLEIARYGYPIFSGGVEPQHWVFFPAFPMFVACVTKITGSYLLSALILNNLLFLLSLILLHAFLSQKYTKDSVLFVVGLLCFYPTSYFFSTPHSESLFLFLLASVLYAISLQLHPLIVSLLLAMLFCTRPTGLLVFPGILLFMRESRISFAHMLLIIFVSAALFSLYLIFLYMQTGDPFIWLNHQSVWGRGEKGIGSIISDFSFVAPWSFNLMHVGTALCVICAVGYFVYLKQFSFALMLCVPLVSCLLTGTFWSLTRIMMPVVPLCIFLQSVCRTQIVRLCTLLFLSSLFGLFCLLYALHVSIAMT